MSKLKLILDLDFLVRYRKVKFFSREISMIFGQKFQMDVGR